MAGILPNEGETLIANLLFKNADVDRGTNIDLILFTNTTISETTSAAALTEPTGGGYARKTLTDIAWSVTADTASYAKQTFTITTTNYSAPVYGYALLSKGTTPRILQIELDSNGPYSFMVGEAYDITPSIVIV